MPMLIVNRLLSKSRTVPKTQIKGAATALKRAVSPEMKTAEDVFQKELLQANKPLFTESSPGFNASAQKAHVKNRPEFKLEQTMAPAHSQNKLNQALKANPVNTASAKTLQKPSATAFERRIQQLFGPMPQSSMDGLK